jgi:signal transduction histidine kinase
VTDGGHEGARSAGIPPDDVIGAVQAELVAALKRADALRAEAEAARLALERSHRQKDDFLAILAHELRNPLAPILNAAELLQATGPHEPRVHRATQILVRQTALLTRLVDDLLDAARISRGKLDLRREVIDFVAVAANAAEDMEDAFRARGIEFTTVLPEAELWIDGDQERLTQALGNLLSNAAKFTDRGGRVTIELAHDESDVARLTISDTGIGMTDELLARVFDPFSQADGNEPRNPSGLGLGTAIARGVIELHGGRIQAASAGVGTGSTFTITLPLHAPAAPRDESPARANAFVQRRVILIDDNVDAAEVVQVALESLGHAVSVAHDGASGVALVKKLAPDLVLCDLGLPGEMDGLAVARQLSTLGQRPYLVALTGYGTPEDRQRALDAGFDLHLTKPVAITVLETIVADLP